MPKPNNKKIDVDSLKINVSDSSLSEFTKRKLPTEKEVENFEDYVEDEAKEEEIDESLSEIYQDDSGQMVDVKKLDIKKKHGFLFWFFTSLLIFSSLVACSYFVYNYFIIAPGSDDKQVELSIDAKSEVIAGEEFLMTIYYKNSSFVDINNARVSLSYPENFIFIESAPAAAEKNSVWQIPKIQAQGSGKITIKGSIIGPADESNVTMASLSYVPQNFSSEFKKEATVTTVVKDIGIDINFDYIKSSLVGEENIIEVKFLKKTESYLSGFRLTFGPQDNIEFGKFEMAADKTQTAAPAISQLRPGVWQIDELPSAETVLPIRFKFTKKINETQNIKLAFEQMSGDKYYKFLEKTIEYEVMKSDLNLTLIINGSREDQGINFGDTLNYSIVYANKGDSEMKDVVIMAVLESDFLSRTSLSDKLNGKARGNTISWSKEEIPELASIPVNGEGTIDFSIKVMELGQIDTLKNYQVKSYVQFTVGNKEEVKESSDNKSNTIINKINSDLSLKEQIRYFNDDNIPVGTGPNPPKVGERTSYKVYWNLNNNLHELNNLKITVKLPDYVSWDEKNQTSVGSINYNSDTREVTWDIGRLPITVFEASGEFSISITPSESDRNKIMVLLPGTSVKAVDGETLAPLEETTKAKTTKLEDDEIAGGDGIVQ